MTKLLKEGWVRRRTREPVIFPVKGCLKETGDGFGCSVMDFADDSSSFDTPGRLSSATRFPRRGNTLRLKKRKRCINTNPSTSQNSDDVLAIGLSTCTSQRLS